MSSERKWRLGSPHDNNLLLCGLSSRHLRPLLIDRSLQLEVSVSKLDDLRLDSCYPLFRHC